MKKVLIVIGAIVLAILFVVSLCNYLGISFLPAHQYKPGEIQPVNNENYHATPMPSIANPASVNCTKQGGNLVMQKRGDGGEYGLCTFDDNRACEEWALFRGECPKGGVKTTGYDTIEEKYCAWRGGQTTAVENAMCTLPNKTVCSVQTFYTGSCPKKDTPASS